MCEWLVAWADSTDEHRDQGRYSLAGRDLGTLLTELQAHALTAGPADRARAPTRIRHDSIARDLVLTLDRRAPRRVWELGSLRHRFGVGGQGPRSVNN